MRDDSLVAPQDFEPAGLLAVLAHHRNRTPTAAAAWVVLREAGRSKHAVARCVNGFPVHFRAADARAVVVVGEEDGGSDVESRRFMMRVEEAMRKHHIRLPGAQLLH